MAHQDSGPPSSPASKRVGPWPPLSLSQRHVSQETSLGRSILLEQQPSLASAAWSKISSSLHVGDSSHSLLLPLQIAGFSLTLRIVLYMESFLVLGNY